MAQFKKKNTYKFWHSPLALIVLFCVFIIFAYNMVGLVKKERETIKNKASELKKIEELRYRESALSRDIKNLNFVQGSVPPLPLADKSYDVITAFQFIEHIHPRKEFIKEGLRVLKPGGVLLVTTPNNKKSLARNPFHVHEYTFEEIQNELKSIGSRFDLNGLNGNKKVNDYYEANGKFVRAILKWDVLGLHKRLPSNVLTAPYNFVTNLMRSRLKNEVKQTTDISTKDFMLQSQNLDETWDIYASVFKD